MSYVNGYRKITIKVSECWVMLKCGCPVDNGTFWYIDAVEEAIGLMMTMKNLLFLKMGMIIQMMQLTH